MNAPRKSDMGRPAPREARASSHLVFIECRGHQARVHLHTAYRPVCSVCDWEGTDQPRLESAAPAAWLHEHGEAHGDARLVCMDEEPDLAADRPAVGGRLSSVDASDDAP